MKVYGQLLVFILTKLPNNDRIITFDSYKTFIYGISD